MKGFQFTVKDTPITEQEAVALVTATSNTTTSPLTIDVSKLCTIKRLTAAKLFEVSVKEGNQNLCTLAYKLSQAGLLTLDAHKDNTQAKKPYTRLSSPVTIKTDILTKEKLTGTLLSRNAKWVNGVCIILTTLKDIENRRKVNDLNLSGDKEPTIKYIAELAVNHLSIMYRNSVNPAILNGFTFNEASGWWTPNKRKTEAGPTFMSTQFYCGLREGLGWGVKHGIFNVTKKNKSNKVNSTKVPFGPTYYIVGLTPFGEELADDKSFKDKMYELSTVE